MFVYFKIPRTESGAWKSHKTQSKNIRSKLLFMHAWSGCDTVYFIFGKSKQRAAKLIKKSAVMHQISTTMSNTFSNHSIKTLNFSV